VKYQRLTDLRIVEKLSYLHVVFYIYLFSFLLLQYDEILGKGAFKTVYGSSIYFFLVFFFLGGFEVHIEESMC
jgi:hypothetical protein